jgi:hypothetical protein
MPIDPLAALGAYLRAQAHPPSRPPGGPERPAADQPDPPVEAEPRTAVPQRPTEED